MSKAVILLDSNQGQVVRVFTVDPGLEVLVADVNVEGNGYGEPYEFRYGFTGKHLVELESVYPQVPVEK